jgi:small-conductance mechanosensitive channel
MEYDDDKVCPRCRKKVYILKEKEDEIKTLKERLESYESQINQLTDSQKEIRDFMDRHDQELLRINETVTGTTRLALAIDARLEGKTKVPTYEEARNNPEFKEWQKNKKRLMQQSDKK